MFYLNIIKKMEVILNKMTNKIQTQKRAAEEAEKPLQLQGGMTKWKN